MLNQKFKCENCKKENCPQLEWDKVRREWICYECEDAFLKEEKNEKANKKIKYR